MTGIRPVADALMQGLVQRAAKPGFFRFLDNPRFYSRLRRSLENTDFARTHARDVPTWLGRLANASKRGEFAMDELNQVLRDPLQQAAAEGRKLTRDDVLALGDANPTTLREVRLGAGSTELPRYEQHVPINDATNYREVVMRLFQPGQTHPYRHAHWSGISNPMVHVRMGDVQTPMGRGLKVGEVQSDWHQQGRMKGYYPKEQPNSAELWDRYNNAFEHHGEAVRLRDAWHRNTLGQLERQGLMKEMDDIKAWDVLSQSLLSSHREQADQIAARYASDPALLGYFEQARANRNMVARAEADLTASRDAYHGRDRFGDAVSPNGGPGAAPEAPFSDTKQWAELAAGRVLDEAATGGASGRPYDLVTIESPSAIASQMSNKGLIPFYRDVLPGVFRTRARRLGATLPETTLPDGSIGFTMTQDFLDRVLKGQPILSAAGVAGLGAAAAGSPGGERR